jgi:hypothetical protein
VHISTCVCHNFGFSGLKMLPSSSEAVINMLPNGRERGDYTVAHSTVYLSAQRMLDINAAHIPQDLSVYIEHSQL